METNLSPEERHRRLLRASREYVHGRITAEQLEEAERLYMPDYVAAAADLVRARRSASHSRKKNHRLPAAD